MSVLRLNRRAAFQQLKSAEFLSTNKKPSSTRTTRRLSGTLRKHSAKLAEQNTCSHTSLSWCHYRYYHQSLNAVSYKHDDFCDQEDAVTEEYIENWPESSEFIDNVTDEQSSYTPAKMSRQKKLLNTSFQYLYNLIQTCAHANLLEDLQEILTGLLRNNAPSVTDKVLELFFYSLYNSDSNDKHSMLTMLQQMLNEVLSSDVELNAVSCCCITAALGKFGESPENMKNIVASMNNKYPLHKSLECLNKDSDVYQDAMLVTSSLGIKVVDDYIPDVPEPPHHDLVKDVYSSTLAPKHSNTVPACNIDTLKKQFHVQLKEELEGFVKVPNVLAQDNTWVTNLNEKQRKLEKLKENWYPAVLKAFQSMRDSQKERWSSKRGVYPFLCVLPDRMYVDIIINHLMNISSSGDITTSLAFSLGSAVFSRYGAKTSLKCNVDRQLGKLYGEYAQLYSQNNTGLHRQAWETLEHQHGKLQTGFPILPWKGYWKVSIGARLLEVLVSSATFSVGENTNVPSTFFLQIPAVFNSYAPFGKKMYGMTIPHPLFSKLVTEASVDFKFDNDALPMVVPPLPWKSSLQGGLLMCPNDFVRSHSEIEFTEPNVTHYDSPQVFPVFDALNVLSSISWKVNNKILDLQLKLLLAKGDAQLGIPPPASESPPTPFVANMNDLTPEEKAIKRAQNFYALKAKREMHSLHCSGLYNLSIANMYRDKTIWFPHNLDFRGRAYPIPRHFNYMGSDVYRSLFLFAEGRPLGSKGLDWLKIHVTNLTGLKKRCSIEERLEFANEMLDEITDSADRPLEGRGWWKKSEDPWQLLAACMELTSALRSPDPTKFVSHLPLHQDGSCNGLQHYAAMGRDIVGAQQVNLSSLPIPQDVYTKVAEVVEKLRAEDAKNGNKLAQKLEGKIDRKVVKQTVMTTVYGVTRFGAVLQVKKQLLERLPRNDVLQASTYTTDLLFKSVKSMFGGASEIQKWLTDAATIISTGKQTVEWTTPLGLRVSQPYYKVRQSKVFTKMQHIYYIEPSQNVNVVKQRNAFPPNFVHSLDATHMMLTALHCYTSGVTFNAIHDCYWTHACDIDHMNVVCREHFVKLHAQPLLHDLAEQFLYNYLPPDGVHDDARYVSKYERKQLADLLSHVPEKGQFDLNEVKKSVYFFS
uniref:DNA-directed RNA polymerase n=1 Tax=Phallusia mammillata TaxID=59560 RepID=A0A6F9DPH6_9ASCI|nr:DNA-directed RNA polymerase, mitochondrial-like [Phallusia mammillata]